MKRIINYLSICLVIVSVFAAVSCSDWTEVGPVEQKQARPNEQNPELWAKYTKALREYKQSEHTMVFASFANGTLNATSEKDFLRSLPDSLDIVSLTNADNFSVYDVEDLSVLREKGTRVVWFVDYAERSAEFSTPAALGTYLDGVVARVAELGLDGFSFSGIPAYGSESEQAAQRAIAAMFIEKFAAVAGPGKELVLMFEGDPQFVAEADRAKIDWFVLNTQETANATDLKMKIQMALEAASVPREKLLLGAMTEFEFIDEERAGSNAIVALTRRVVESGPLAGLCIYSVNQDYFGSEVVYSLTRRAIQTLNPSKL